MMNEKIKTVENIFLISLENSGVFKCNVPKNHIIIQKIYPKIYNFICNYQKDLGKNVSLSEVLLWYGIFLSNEINDKEISPKIISLSVDILVSLLVQMNRTLPSELIDETKEILSLRYINQPKNLKYTTNIIGFSLAFKYATKVITTP